MNPVYKFTLSLELNGLTRTYDVNPSYTDAVAKEYTLQSKECFYRESLSGKLTFLRRDYNIIRNANFETMFLLTLYISYDGGMTFTQYWKGRFFKTDCTINEDDKTIVVTPTSEDEYVEVLAGMEKEYNLIDLKPEIDNLIITKRPLIQMYVPGESVVSCFLSGMYWEQDCEVITDENELVNTYHFSLNSQRRIISMTQTDGTIELPKVFNGDMPVGQFGEYQYNEDGFVFHFYRVTGSGYVTFYWDIERNGVALWRYSVTNQNPPSIPFEITLLPVSGTGAMGTVTAYVYDTKVFARYLLDVDTIAGKNTQPIPANDIIENNRNYRRVIGYAVDNVVSYSANTSNTPTEWGIKQPGEYWQQPYSLYVSQFYPIGRSHWGDISIWFAFSSVDELMEESGRKTYTLKDAYPLHSVISVLLAKIAPGITHEPTTEYSKFLYDNYNPVSGDSFDLFITQKSNILAGDYTQPAQKAPITLKMITNMLRDCYRAYWYIEDGKFKIEHIQWFKNGGSYTGIPAVSHDLTTEFVTRTGKPWAFGTSQYAYSKPTMPEHYNFGWMDDVTRAFEGYPIEILSKYVTPGNIEEVNVSNFTTDIDYMLLNPGACSKDGFALMAAVKRQLVTPDTASRTIAIGTYDVTYQLINSQVNEGLRIKFQTSGSAFCEMAFLDASNNLVSTIGTFNAGQTEQMLSAMIPENATQIAVRQLTRFGVSEIKMLSVLGASYLPFIERTIGDTTYVNQNGLLAFIDLQPKYYVYDLPAYNVLINEQQVVVYGIQRGKEQQLRCPMYIDPNPMQLIKTHLGNGAVAKLSVNLSSRNAQITLNYDTTEQ